MITYFAHATSSDNEAGIRSGWNDPPLSGKGRSQAAALREAIAHRHFQVVFSSDLTRALQTAEIVFPEASVRTDERLREMNYGLLNGHPAGDFPDDERWCIGNRFEEGENCLDVQRRVESFLNDNCGGGGNVAIVAHRFPQLAMEVLVNGLEWDQAFERDWRKTGAWQPGWEYRVRA